MLFIVLRVDCCSATLIITMMPINGVKRKLRNSSKDRSSSACRSARLSKKLFQLMSRLLRTPSSIPALASVTSSNYFNTVFQKIGLLTSLKPMKIKYLNWWIICQQKLPRLYSSLLLEGCHRFLKNHKAIMILSIILILSVVSVS